MPVLVLVLGQKITALLRPCHVVERSPSINVNGVLVSPCVDQQLNGACHAFSGSNHQRCHATLAWDHWLVNSDPFGAKQQPHRVFVPKRTCSESEFLKKSVGKMFHRLASHTLNINHTRIKVVLCGTCCQPLHV